MSSAVPPRFPSSEERPHNPFKEKQRDNFPCLDSVFQMKNHSIEIESTCSQGSSFLNISIGARAALAEHMRHVAKYGIDGEEDENGDDDCEREEAIELHLVERKNPLDDQWDYLLSDEHSDNVNGSFAQIDCIETSAVDTSFAGLTDISNSADYFNSSRVKLLVTPERNKNKSGMVITREDAMNPFDDEEEDDDDFSPTNNFAVPPEVLDQEQQEEFPRVFSFNSLNGVDISRISNANSFHDQGNFSPEEDTFSNIMEDIPHSSSLIHDSSFYSSTPLRHPPPSCDTTPRPLSKQGKLPRSTRKGKENADSWASPSAILHGSASPLVQRDSNQRGLEQLPNDFLQALDDIQKEEQPSPILPRKQTKRNLFGGQSSTTAPPPSLTGRKLYRTVVPRRVFLDSASEDFLEKDDSFSIPYHEETSPTKSLMSSFEEAAVLL